MLCLKVKMENCIYLKDLIKLDYLGYILKYTANLIGG